MAQKVIDVSEWQGEINWSKVKQNGYHAIIRYGASRKDKWFDYNIKECTRLNIPFGVYLYSHASTSSQAKQEAQRVISLIKPYNLSYPVYYDIEQNGLQKTAILTSKVFCQEIEKFGYLAGIYANENWWLNYLNDNSLNKWTKWCAKYSSHSPKVTHDMWQFTSKGQIPGVSGNCDVSIAYVDFSKEIKNQNKGENMGNRQAIVDYARKYVGCRRGDSGHKDILRTYNSYKPGRGYRVQPYDAWCATFVSAMAIKSGNAGIVPLECSCYYQTQIAKKMGIWVENDNYLPRPGDIIMYDWQDSGYGDNTGSPDHVGIVEYVSGNTITVIEGNKHNAVARRKVTRNQRYIRGYITPKYSSSSAANNSKPSKSLDVIVQEIWAGAWGSGAERKRRLEAAGYNYSEVQKAVNKKVKPNTNGRPHRRSISVDGWIGYNSVKAWQEVLGSKYRDGVISGQYWGSKKRHYALTSIRYGIGGSTLVKDIQKLLGLKQDGYMGPDTIKAWQRHIGVNADGWFGPATAKATQKWINNRL